MSVKTDSCNLIYVIPFSHLDLFWAGTREECLSRGTYIIKRALDLLEKHADFRFLLETMNFVDHYLDCFPEEEARVKRFVGEGRLGLAPAWTGIYLNLPGGETLIRNAVFGKRFARERLGGDPLIAHFGDLPGYTPQYPQIAKLCGIKGMLMSRGGPAATPLFDWKGLDGSVVRSFYARRGYHSYCMLADEDYSHFSDGTHFGSEKLEETFDKDAGSLPYPTMIHWGLDLFCPPERLVFNVRRWNSEKRWQLRFSTLESYFGDVAKTPSLPVLSGELPSAWPNIESSWPDIWPLDFPCESSLRLAELLSCLCLEKGWRDYPAAELESAWKLLLDAMDHNQNSQGGETADKDKLALKRRAAEIADAISTRMSWRLASKVKSPAANAFPVVVFNSLSWERDGIARGRASLCGDVKPFDAPGWEKDLKLVDFDGNVVPFVQLQRYQCCSSSLEIAFPFKKLPPCGWQAFYLTPGKNPAYESETCSIKLDAEEDRKGCQRNQGANVYENEFFKLEIDLVTGEASVFDKRLARVLFDKTAVCGVEERRGNYISNMTPTGRAFPALCDSIETLENNGVWCKIRVSGSVYGMPLRQTWTLYKDFADILLENEIDWREPRWVRLEQLFQFKPEGQETRYEVPFGQVRYPEAMGQLSKTGPDELEPELRNRLRLSRSWVDVGSATDGVSIGCDHRMWEFEEGVLRSYMIRGVGFCGGVTVDTDGVKGNLQRPPAGTYKFSYLLRPRAGSLAESRSFRCGWELNNPVKQTASVAPDLAGPLPPSFSLLDFSASTAIVSAVKKAEKGEGLVVRAFEAAGEGSAVELPALSAGAPFETDALEEGARALSGRALEFKPFEIKTVLFKKA